MDDDFAAAISAACRDAGGKGIGTMGEKTLHLALKYYFAPDAATHERPLGGFIADAVTEDGVVEVQTRGLSRLKPKLDAFLPLCPVTVVYPIIAQKWIVRVDENGEQISRRRSPKHETIYTAMRELYTLRDYLNHPRMRICLCALDLEEYVTDSGKRKRTRLDRMPIALHQLWMLETPADYAALLPKDIPDQFTAAQFAEQLNTPEMYARMYLNLLSRLGCVVTAGKLGKAKLWKMAAANHK